LTRKFHHIDFIPKLEHNKFVSLNMFFERHLLNGNMKEYMTIKEASEKWGIGIRRIKSGKYIKGKQGDCHVDTK